MAGERGERGGERGGRGRWKRMGTEREIKRENAEKEKERKEWHGIVWRKDRLGEKGKRREQREKG